jgi:hypothetical protein
MCISVSSKGTLMSTASENYWKILKSFVPARLSVLERLEDISDMT